MIMMRNEDDKKVNSNENLDELMKAASKNVDYNPQDNNDKKGKSNKKVIVLSLIGLLAFGSIFAVGALTSKNPQDFEDKSKTPGWTEQEGVENIEGEEDSVVTWDFKTPIKLKEWASTPYIVDEFWNNDKIEDVLLAEAREKRGFNSAVSWMNSGIPSPYDDDEIAGPYTNDISKRYLEDGITENPEFSYALAEDYQKAYVTYMERLINPSFGGWSSMQYSEIDIKNDPRFHEMRDMFTSEWWIKNVEENSNFTKLPILVEWEKGDWDKYGIKEKTVINQGVFYGEISEDEERYITVEDLGIDEENQSIIKVNSPVKYYALSEKGKPTEITGTLELTLQSNQENLNIENRVIISEAKLLLDN